MYSVVAKARQKNIFKRLSHCRAICAGVGGILKGCEI